MAQVWSNNAVTALAEALADSATSLTVVASAGFASLSAGQYELVTLEDGTLREIVKVTARSGTAWTIARAQEGTTARAWPSGTRVSARLTAGTLAGLTQTALTPDLAALDHGGNARGTYAVNLQSGRTAAANVASGAYAVATGYDSKASGANSFAAGTRAVASGQEAVAIGRDAQATGYGATAVGSYSMAFGGNAVAIHGRAVGEAAFAARGNAYGDYSVALGGYAYATSRFEVVISGYQSVPRDDWFDQSEVLTAGAQAAFCTPYVDLGVPPDWVAATAYENGDIVKPTTGGTVQYRVWADWPIETGIRETATSTATEPTWPGAGDSVEIDADGDHYWIGIDWSAGYETMAIPAGLAFFPTELAFICHEHSALTGTPNVSIGTAATPGLLVDADDVTVTAAHQIYRFTIANPTPAIPSGTAIKITVNTAASAGRCVGRFLISGYFVENPTNAV